MSHVHPEKEVLIAFGQGKLTGEDSAQIEQHLDVCPACCETLLDLKEDTFVGLLRRAKQNVDVPSSETVPIEPAADDVDVKRRREDAATILVQSGEAVSVDELPAELRDHPRYRIVELIGRGGMGNVYRAEHRLMNRPVAIKLINSQLIRQPNAVERFRREVQAAAKLTHPNIVTAYDAEQAGDVHFLVMEFVEGTDLASVVKQRGPMSVAEACECIRQAAEGLQHAHEKGMVHRDIKPHNLMLSAEGQVRILDFGLAGFVTEAALEGSHVRRNVGDTRVAPQSGDSGHEFPQAGEIGDDSPPSGDGGYEATAAHLTTAGSVMGTPDYIAPEQAKDAHSADIRADIYSLGCTLQFLLTGKPPFVADSVLAKLKAHAQETPPSLATIRSDVPVELQRVAAKMMAKVPAERFQTPAEVAAALAPFSQSAQAPPKRRTLRTMLAAAAVILLAGVIFITTDKGRVEIRSDRDDVELVIRQNGAEIKAIDLQTGTQVTWLPSGEYSVVLRDGNDYINLEKSGFKLSRWGKEIVTVKREAAVQEAADTPVGKAAAPTKLVESAGQAMSASRDFAAVTAYLNDPRNNADLAVPVVLVGREGIVSIRFGNWLVAFEDILCEPTSGILGSFNIPRRDARDERNEGTLVFAAGKKLPAVFVKFKLGDKQHELSINNHRFRLQGKATRLEFDGKAYDATNSVQTILVARDGSTRLESPPNTASQTSQVLKRLEPNEELVTTGGVTREDGGWKIQSDRPRTVILMELVEPEATDGGLRALATVKTQGLTAEASLQLKVGMSSRQFPLAANMRSWPLNNQPDWSPLELAFQIAADKRPPWVQMAVTFKGAGTVWVKDVSLRHESPRVFATQFRQSPRVPLLADGINLLSDASFESSLVSTIPFGWERATTNDPESRCEIVAGGRTDKQSLQVTVKQTRASVHSNSFHLDRTKRYTIRGWIKFEGDKDSRATFKLSYFQNAKMLEVRDVVSIAPDPSGWQRIETTDTLESIPAANRLLATCHVEGSGSAWFDDLELVVHDKEKVAVNLITDPSFENTALTLLPRDWRAWTNEDSDFRCEVVNGGHTGQRSLRISGKGIRGVVFGNDIKADRTKRYAFKGWAKFEGDKDARAIIKFNYFRGSEYLGVHDLVGVTADQPGWHLFEKTDALDAYPQADHFYVMCHVEGSGSGWFDDLELLAYDRDKLPADFDSRHGRHNRLTGPNSLDRWVGAWESQYAFRESDYSPNETKLTMNTASERTLGDYFLLSHAKAVPVAPKDRKPPLADPQENALALGGEERLLFLTFDQNLGAFRQWFFSSNGKAFEWRGPWDDATKSLELRMLPDSSKLFSSERFVDADHIEAKLRFQYVMSMKDAGRWTATRKAAAAKVDVPAAKSRAAEPTELSQLDKFAGEWTIRAKYKPSVWNPLPREETIRETSIWILGGRFLMTRAFNEKDELTSIWIATYEPREKSNRFWFFNADGSSGEWRLTWDEPSSGFQFRAVDLPTGWSGTGFNRWVDDDSFDNQALIKDETGRVLLDSTQERRRKK